MNRVHTLAGVLKVTDWLLIIDLVKVLGHYSNRMTRSGENVLKIFTFKDIDECATPNVCRADETCLNTRGGYYCNAIVCPPNYVRDQDHRK
jgi:hypothetical protein